MVLTAALAEETFALNPVRVHPVRRRDFKLIPGKRTEPKHPSASELVLQHREIAWRLALRMVTRWGSRIEHEELRSLTDTALCEAASRYRYDAGAAFMTFFFYHLKGCLVKTIAARSKRNLLLVDDVETLLHKTGRTVGEEATYRKEIAVAADYCDEVSLEDAVVIRDLVNKCVLASSKLRGLDREIIQRVYINGEDLNSLPDSMGFSRGHIFRVRSRAIAKLKKMLKA